MKICSMRRKLAILLCLATLVSMSAPASAAFLPSEIAKETITESTDDSDWYMAGANPQRTSWVSEEVRGKLYVTVTVVEGTKPIGHLIKDLVVSSGKSYQIDILGVGKHPYIDRDFLFTEVPASLHNYFYIRTANDDRDYADKDHLRFTLMQSTKVYIAFDQRASHLPDWLTGWTLESELLAIGDEEF
jgi:ABC-type Fe3+-hydroxamate transport system substrate-binding protein